MKANQLASELAYSTYRKTPLADDERLAGDKMDKDWPVYQEFVQKFVALMKAGDVEGGNALLRGDLQKSYRIVMDELTLMVESTIVRSAKVQRTPTPWSLQPRLRFTPALPAFIAAFALGLFISRLISRPIATAVTSAQRIANGDLTQNIVSTGRDEGGQLLSALSDMQISLKGTIQQISSASDQLASAAEELTAVTDNGSRGWYARTTKSSKQPPLLPR